MKPLDTPKDKNGVQKSEEAAAVETASEETPAVNTNDPSMPIFDAKKPDFASLVIEPLFEDLVDFETFSKSDFRAVKVKDCVAVPKSKKLLQFTGMSVLPKKRDVLHCRFLAVIHTNTPLVHQSGCKSP